VGEWQIDFCFSFAIMDIRKNFRNAPTMEQMSRELVDAGWSTWEQMIQVWVTPDGAAMFGTKQAWEVMARERAKRLDS
jgi:hypothetical protein